MADPNPNLDIYRPGRQTAGIGEVSEPPRCEARSWRGEPCILAIHEGPCVFVKPRPRLRDTLSYWWIWLCDEARECFAEFAEAFGRWWSGRC